MKRVRAAVVGMVVVSSFVVLAIKVGVSAQPLVPTEDEPPAPSEEEILQPAGQAMFIVEADFPPQDPGVRDDDGYMAVDPEWVERASEAVDQSLPGEEGEL